MEFHLVHTKGNQSWIFIGGTNAEAESPKLCPPDVKNWLIGKDPDAGKDWKQEEKETTEDKMVRWHNWLTQWTWVWASSGSWWWTGKAGVLHSMGSQRVRYNWWLNLTELSPTLSPLLYHVLSQICIRSVSQFSRSVVSDSLWPHGLHAAPQASLSIINSQSLLRLMSIELVIPSNHLILYCPLLLPPSVFPSIRVFSNESVLRIRWPKDWSFSFNISPSKEYSEYSFQRISIL